MSQAVTPVRPPEFRLPWKTIWQVAGVALLVALAAGSVVFVDETELVIVERLGIITAVYDQTAPAKSDRGLHFKLPWPIETVKRFDRRLQLFDPRGREMFTRDRKNIIVDAYLCWRIAAPAGQAADDAVPADVNARPVVKFYRSLGAVSTAEARLDTRIRSVLSAEMGKLSLGDLLIAADSEAEPSAESPLAQLAERVLEQVRQQPEESGTLAARLGIEVVDMGIQRVNLPEGNLFAVYERMRKERDKIAQRYRSAGEAEKLVLESQARRQSSELLARANLEAARIRAEAEAKALTIRNTAHALDPEFYAWLRNLETYQKVLSSQTTLVLSASSPFLRLLMAGADAEGGGVDSFPEVTTQTDETPDRRPDAPAARGAR